MDTGAMTPSSLVGHHIDQATGPITAFDISSNQRTVSFGDECGCLHLYTCAETSGPDNRFNAYSQETQFADVVCMIRFA